MVTHFIHWKALSRSVFVMAMAFIDVVMGFVQVFWGVDDLFCSHQSDDSFMTVLQTEPRKQVTPPSKTQTHVRRMP